MRPVASDSTFSVAGLFAGIGGIELGLSRHGGETELLCEYWEPAKAVLAERFPEIPLVGDIRELRSLPKVDVVSAGFPCTDLSQAGRMHGISGEASGLVGEVNKHQQPKAALGAIAKVEQLPRRSGDEGVGYDGLGIVLVNLRNDGSPVTVADEPPVPVNYQYGRMILRLAGEYDVRFRNA